MAGLIRIEVHKDTRYKTISLDPIDRAPELTWKAKGLWVYLISRPPGWEMRFNDLLNRAKDGKDSLRSGMNELKEYGYLTIEPIKGEKGLWNGWKWIVRETPETEQPNDGNAGNPEDRLFSNRTILEREHDSSEDLANARSSSEYASAFPDLKFSEKIKELKEHNASLNQKTRVGYVADVLLGLPDKPKLHAKEVIDAAGGMRGVYKLVVAMLTRFPVDFLADWGERSHQVPWKNVTIWNRYLMGALGREYEQWRISEEEKRYRQELENGTVTPTDILDMAREKLVPRWSENGTS